MRASLASPGSLATLMETLSQVHQYSLLQKPWSGRCHGPLGSFRHWWTRGANLLERNNGHHPPNNGGAQPFRFNKSHLRGPIAAETAAYHPDPFGVHFGPLFQIIDHGAEKGIRSRRCFDRACPDARHIDGAGRESYSMHGFFVFEGLRFEAIDSAEV